MLILICYQMFRAIVVVALSLAGSVAPTCNSIPNNPVTAQDPANYRNNLNLYPYQRIQSKTKSGSFDQTS